LLIETLAADVSGQTGVLPHRGRDDAVRTWYLIRYAGVADEMTAITLSILTSRNSPQR
jgi:hypothetical protein